VNKKGDATLCVTSPLFLYLNIRTYLYKYTSVRERILPRYVIDGEVEDAPSFSPFTE